MTNLLSEIMQLVLVCFGYSAACFIHVSKTDLFTNQSPLWTVFLVPSADLSTDPDWQE